MSLNGTDIKETSKRYFQTKKRCLKIQNIFLAASESSESRSVTGIKGKEHELPFYPHFIYEGFTSLNMVS